MFRRQGSHSSDILSNSRSKIQPDAWAAQPFYDSLRQNLPGTAVKRAHGRMLRNGRLRHEGQLLTINPLLGMKRPTSSDINATRSADVGCRNRAGDARDNNYQLRSWFGV